MRLRTGLRVLRRGRTEVQVGTDPRWAVRLPDLTPGEVELLVAVDHRTDLTALPARAAAAGLDAERVGHVVAQLHAARLTAPPPSGGTVPGPATPDAVVWSLLRPDADGAAVVRRRGRRTVAVVGLGPTGLGVALTLAAGGVGTLLLDDPRPVRSTDVGPTGYRWDDVGARRASAAARHVRDVAPRVTLDTTREADVLVVVEHGAADPARTPVLVSRGTPHLSVVVREAGTVVGPFVVPGAGPCLRCLDLHRADADPGWPLLVADLSSPGDRRDPGDSPGEPAAAATVSAGLAAAAVLAHLDDHGWPPGLTYEVAFPDAVPRRRTWAVHPECGCTALPAPCAESV